MPDRTTIDDIPISRESLEALENVAASRGQELNDYLLEVLDAEADRIRCKSSG